MVIPDLMRGKNAGLNAGGDAIRNADWKAVWNAAREAGWNVSKDVRVDSAGDAGEEARLDAVRDPGGKTGGNSREIHPAQKTLSENPFRTRLMAFPVPDAP